MERDAGFRSWFQRAIQLSPSLRQTDNSENDDSVDGEDHFDGIIDGTRAKIPAGRVGMAEQVSRWSLLLKDNVRFWDCLAMLRSDPALSCHSAIYLVTQSPDSEYFPEELRLVNSNYFKDEEELQTEILRLVVENRKLHAVLWVLSDNPHFRVDSVVAAIFRLNETQFEEKFHFVYHPGCFSGMSPVLGPGTKGADKGGASIAMHTKRCRSSTPVRTCRPLRHVSDRLCHSVTRSNTYRRGKNVSSNKSKCPIHKYEPPRKRRSDWMKSALLTGLDNKSTNNTPAKMWDSDGHADVDECPDGLNDPDDNSCNDDGFNFESYFTTNDCSKKRPEHSQSRWDLSRRKSMSMTKNTCASSSYNDKTVWSNSKFYSTNNNNSYNSTFFDYIGSFIVDGRKSHFWDHHHSDIDLVSVSDGSTHESHEELPVKKRPDYHYRKSTKPRMPSIHRAAPVFYKHSQLTGESCNFSTPVVILPDISSTSSEAMPVINYSDSPAKACNRSTPYAVTVHNTPDDYICHQNRNNIPDIPQRRSDIKFCPKLKRSGNTSMSRKKSADGRNSQQRSESLVKALYTRATHLDHDIKDLNTSDRTTIKPIENKASASVQSCPISTLTTSKVSNNVSQSGNEARSRESMEKSPSDKGEITPSVDSQRPFPLWDTSKDRCACLKSTLSKMGRYRYTKALRTMIDRSCSENL